MTFDELLEQVHIGKATAFSVVEDASGKKLTVEQRQLLPEAPRPPIKRESDRRAHTFFEVKSFAAYLKKYKTTDTVLYGDPQAGVVHAILNEKATDGREILLFRPMIHPQWAPWETLLSVGKMDLSAFVDFILNNRRAIGSPPPRDLIYELSQIKATSTTEIQRGRGKNSINGIMVKTLIQGQEKADLVELPETLGLTIPIYVRTSPRSIEIDLCIELQDGEIVVSAAAGGILEAKVAAFEEMFTALEALSTEGLIVTMGSPSEKPWSYLAEKSS